MKIAATIRMWGTRMRWVTHHKETVMVVLASTAAVVFVVSLLMMLISYAENLKTPASKAVIEKVITEHNSPLCMRFVLKRHYQANQLITNRVISDARAECNGRTMYGDGAVHTQQIELREIFK